MQKGDKLITGSMEVPSTGTCVICDHFRFRIHREWCDGKRGKFPECTSCVENPERTGE